jgi:hypothetical protein
MTEGVPTVVDDIDAAFGAPPESAAPSPESPPAIESPGESPAPESAADTLDRAISLAFRAVDNAIIAGPALGHWLKAGHPPATASLAEGLRHYGAPGAVFDLWVGWRALELLRAAWTGKLSGVLELAVPLPAPPEPDEAPGIVPPPAPPDPQQRLAGVH